MPKVTGDIRLKIASFYCFLIPCSGDKIDDQSMLLANAMNRKDWKGNLNSVSEATMSSGIDWQLT